MYCGKVCDNIKWKVFTDSLANFTSEDMENMGKTLASSYAHGFGINFGNYINSPHIYQKHMDTLRTNVFRFKEAHTLYAQVIIFRRWVALAIDSLSLEIVYVVVL